MYRMIHIGRGPHVYHRYGDGGPHLYVDLGTGSANRRPHIDMIPVLAIRMAGNCWLSALNVAVVHGLLLLRGCFVFVKKQKHVDFRALVSHCRPKILEWPYKK